MSTNALQILSAKPDNKFFQNINTNAKTNSEFSSFLERKLEDKPNPKTMKNEKNNIVIKKTMGNVKESENVDEVDNQDKDLKNVDNDKKIESTTEEKEISKDDTVETEEELTSESKELALLAVDIKSLLSDFANGKLSTEDLVNEIESLQNKVLEVTSKLNLSSDVDKSAFDELLNKIETMFQSVSKDISENKTLDKEDIIKQIIILSKSTHDIAIASKKGEITTNDFTHLNDAISKNIIKLERIEFNNKNEISNNSESLENSLNEVEGLNKNDTKSNDGTFSNNRNLKDNSSGNKHENLLKNVSKVENQAVVSIDQSIKEFESVFKIPQKIEDRLNVSKNIMDQISFGIKNNIKLSENGSQMTIKLFPKELGEVTLKIEVHKNNVSAQFNVESNQVKAVLESSFNELKNSLASKGYDIGGLNVNVGSEHKESKQNNYKNNEKKYSIDQNLDIDFNKVEAFNFTNQYSETKINYLG
jgi:flagellar hook-length control protein FliK